MLFCWIKGSLYVALIGNHTNHLNLKQMNAELLNEFYLLQESRSNVKYLEVLDEKVYMPVRNVNKKVSTWMNRRGLMLMNLENKVNRSVRKLRRKYFRF